MKTLESTTICAVQPPESMFMRFDYEPQVANFRGCTGFWFDSIYSHRTGKTETMGMQFNIIVDSIGRLAAARFKGDVAYGGIQMWAVGAGADTWDAAWDVNPPTAVPGAQHLVNEIGRLPIGLHGDSSSIVFVDQQGVPTQSLTNRILVKRTFGRDECNGVWREFAIFGGNATDARGSGIMINHKIHKAINKTDEMTVERNIIFTFN